MKKIVWAIDLGAAKDKATKKAAIVLKTLLGKSDWLVVPAYVAHSEDLRAPKVGSGAGKAAFGSPPLMETMNRVLKGIKGLKLDKPALLREKGVYLNSQLDALVGFAKEQSAAFIVLNTHSRTGLARFWMGSFAETAALHSKVPLLLVSPSARPEKRYKSVLFPTDMSEPSKRIYGRVLDFASELGLDVVLYHRLQTYHELTGFSVRPTPVFASFRKELVAWAERELQPMRQMAEGRGLKVKVVLTQTGPSLAEDILAKAKAAGTVLAMSGRTGSLGSVVIGSSTRQVIRAASCPVWILHETS